ncbi:MAG: glycosyltransferase family 2 protein [Nitrospinae bacterium]|nr:glycosyltransferase family 2 protein [Nitrospinota bacterium]
MKISIIIPAYNSAKTIGHAIEACRQLVYPDKEIIVVDDGSTDNTVEIASRYGKQVSLIRLPHQGAASARNAGWKAATGEVCFFTDPDCMPRSDVLALFAPHFKRQNIGAVGGTYDIANPHKLLARLLHEEASFRHRFLPHFVDLLGSFNCAYRREALEQVGGFNEEYGAASGGVNDLPVRLMKNNWRFEFDVRAAVAHHFETSLGRYLQKQFHYGVWRVKLFKDKKSIRLPGAGGMGYADFVNPLFGLLLVMELPLLLFEAGRTFYCAVLAVYTFLQLPLPLVMAVNRAGAEPLLLVPLTFVRGIVRGLGVAAGFLKFKP